MVQPTLTRAHAKSDVPNLRVALAGMTAGEMKGSAGQACIEANIYRLRG